MVRRRALLGREGADALELCGDEERPTDAEWACTFHYQGVVYEVDVRETDGLGVRPHAPTRDSSVDASARRRSATTPGHSVPPGQRAAWTTALTDGVLDVALRRDHRRIVEQI